MVGKTVFILEEHLDDEGVLDLSQYTHLRAYHACRPLCIDDYMVSGIQVIQKKQALQDSQIRIKSDYVDADKIKKNLVSIGKTLMIYIKESGYK